jgi:hypothetical protein
VPNLTTIQYLRVTGSSLWLTNAIMWLWLSRTHERRLEEDSNAKILLCGIRPEAHAVNAEVQILVSGLFYAAAIWQNNPIYPLRVAGNFSWLLGASLSLGLVSYEYNQARRKAELQTETQPSVTIEEVVVESSHLTR